MEVILIRHTKVHNPRSVCYGQSDIGLASSFENEKDNIISKLTLTGQFTVYSSPAQRCTRLAETITSTYKVDTRLQEVNFGDWENTPWQDIPQLQLTPWMEDFVTIQPPNGESFQDLHTRVKEFITELQQNDFDKVIVITHAGVIRSILCDSLGIPLVNAFRLTIDYGSLSKLIFSDYPPQLKSLNL
ncbi:alpha-ribazole phosphatase [Cytophagaceae bacterium DM2B3-1]|uniref:Alpha-ribazole phosphatase n=1 Tax=Xanthocytophaga flava TaxID=3048013 RepID=A0ABT7CF96_9BACT|nr:alpha-ribazole phosphatase [Xanthocytophaga flavus]MDJ1472902.1 alpha-ribazole phosphatase [Xanthocytophaga flavus]MDJ1492420.1 alpha-ribazole phosphatase [Xanthocytophaga flavus]